jgi:hypothetical protein
MIWRCCEKRPSVVVAGDAGAKAKVAAEDANNTSMNVTFPMRKL